MSKPIKNLIVDTYKKRFTDVDSAVMVSLRGVKSSQNTTMRHSLAEKGIRVTVVKNSLATRAWKDSPLEGLTKLLEGACAVATGGESAVNIARALLEQKKEIEALEFRGALMEGTIFGPDQIEALSKYPTREEAQAQVVSAFLGPARQVAGAVVSAGSMIASILTTIEEKGEKAA